MSRLIVKNIGKTTNEKQLKDLFSSKGEVTDVRILKTKSGKSRQFAFIGFRNEAQCQEAQKYFNNTFIQTSRMSVEVAKPLGDPTLSSAKSRHTKQKLEKIQKEKEKEAAKIAEKKKDTKPEKKPIDRSKLEFMEAMKSRRQANVWDNDDSYKALQEQQMKTLNPMSDDDSSDEEYQESAKGALVHEGSSSEDEESEDEVKGKGVSKSAPLSDMDFLRAKVSKHISDSDSDSDSDNNSLEDNESGDGDGSSPSHKKSKSNKATKEVRFVDNFDDDENDDEVRNETDVNEEENVGVEGGSSMDVDEPAEEEEMEGEDGRLFVRNLPFGCSEEELTELFSQFGPVSQTHLPLDADRRGKGFGFVQFMFPEHSQKALEALDGTSFQGRLLHVLFAKSQHKKQEDNDNNLKNSHLSAFQRKKEEERRKMANKREGWNASFVRSDAVVDSLSDRYGVSRGEILDTDGSGGGELAVRLAIGETHVLQENKEYFAAHGVDLEVLESALSSSKKGRNTSSSKSDGTTKDVKRSSTTMLIKNLPHDMVPDELEDMFSRYGAISSFLVPKSKTVALVDFIEPADARKAFSGLAYRRYHHVPLYLEWAPLNTIDKSKATAENREKSKKNSPSTPTASTSTPAADDLGDYSTLFVKNLNFITTEDGLMRHLTGKLGINRGEIRAVSIPQKQKNGHNISMGFGFIEFTKTSGASSMVGRIDKTVLDGHSLEVKPSDKRLSAAPAAVAAAAKEKDGTNKLIVRNVAFQATKEELRALFSSFGSVKTIRIPKKLGGVHRGFAFVDFNTKQEAAAAKAALTNTHMYGRHLVIEYAKDDSEDMEGLRVKAKQDAKAIKTAAAAASRKRKVGDILDSKNQSSTAGAMYME